MVYLVLVDRPCSHFECLNGGTCKATPDIPEPVCVCQRANGPSGSRKSETLIPKTSCPSSFIASSAECITIFYKETTLKDCCYTIAESRDAIKQSALGSLRNRVIEGKVNESSANVGANEKVADDML
ncbi:hypothetical protein M513_07933 [Trichuris suis]|uniref:EGF-like domain-containing protein n=1 Tax=Trichuris suis TaxID=68888 RepID=A0A085M1S3_9BILA|nr:hypothetical protein M513_07933 [Trichuris suis]